MKSINKNKSILAFFIGLLIVIGVAIGIYSANNSSLSADQITSLREQYPIVGIEVPVGLSMGKMPLSEVIVNSDSFVYGEVVGDVSMYYVDAYTGISSLDEKRKQNGIEDTYKFYEYTIDVIDDSEGKYAKGEQIKIASNTDFIDYNPKLYEGMQVVVPVVKDDTNSSRHYYTVDGFYYVTSGGYAISAFDDTVSNSQKSFSGVNVKQLLNKLKK